MKLYTPTAINEIKEKYGFNFSKSLGQNFLIDKNIVDKIVEGSNIEENDLVIEIGPGIGVITDRIAEDAKEVIAIEIDKNLPTILNDTLKHHNNIQIINNDILKVDLNQVIKDLGYETAKIIGNLPYYITTPIIMYILENKVNVDSITIMMQKEVADRIKAKPGSKTYGSISVAVQYYCDVETVVNVPKGSFIPRPKIDSTVLKLTLRKEPEISLLDEKTFFECIKAGFGQRRKTLLNSLSTLSDLTKEDIKEILEEAEIDFKRRAETLSIEDFGKLTNLVYKKRGNF